MNRNLESEIISSFKGIVGKHVRLSAEISLADDDGGHIRYTIKNSENEKIGISLEIESILRGHLSGAYLMKKSKNTIGALKHTLNRPDYTVTVIHNGFGSSSSLNVILATDGKAISVSDEYKKGKSLKEGTNHNYKRVFERALEIYQGLKKSP